MPLTYKARILGMPGPSPDIPHVPPPRSKYLEYL